MIPKRRSMSNVIFRNHANSASKAILTIQSLETIVATKLSKIGRKAKIANDAVEGRPSDGVSGPISPITRSIAENEPKLIAIATDLAFGLITGVLSYECQLLGGGLAHEAVALLLVAGEGAFDDGEGGVGGTDVFDIDALAF